MVLGRWAGQYGLAYILLLFYSSAIHYTHSTHSTSNEYIHAPPIYPILPILTLHTPILLLPISISIPHPKPILYFHSTLRHHLPPPPNLPPSPHYRCPRCAKPALSPGSVFLRAQDHRAPEELNPPFPPHRIRIETGSRAAHTTRAGTDERPKPQRLQGR